MVAIATGPTPTVLDDGTASTAVLVQNTGTVNVFVTGGASDDVESLRPGQSRSFITAGTPTTATVLGLVAGAVAVVATPNPPSGAPIAAIDCGVIA